MKNIIGHEYLNNIPPAWRRTEDTGSGYRTTKIKKTKYGYIIHRFSNYVSLQYIRFEVLKTGFGKATIKVDTNYQQKRQYTIYFDKNMAEIKAETTAKERKIWLELQKSKQ